MITGHRGGAGGRWIRRVAFALVVICAYGGDDLRAQARQRTSSPAELIASGHAAFEAQRYDEALDAYARAVKSFPDDATLQFLIGYSSLMLGQFSAAQAPLEKALSLNPRLTDASSVLAITLYRQGKVADAVRVLDAGLKFAPADKSLLELASKWRPEASLQDRMYEARGAHFSVLFQGPADDLAARRIVELLEEAYWRIGRTLSTYPTETVPVILYTQEQFRSVAGAPDWAGAVYDGRIKVATRGALENTADLRSTLAHEFVHVVVAQLAGAAPPVWLNEGLAELLESDDFSRVERSLSRSSARLPHARLERDFIGLSNDELVLAYAQSAFAVKKMVELRGAPAVVSLLQALGRGTSFGTAFQQAIGMRYEDFVTMVARY